MQSPCCAGGSLRAAISLLMQVRMASKDLVVVLLDSWGKNSRIGDANRIKRWMETRSTGNTSG